MESVEDHRILEQLKRMLISRDGSRQSIAVEYLCKTLNNQINNEKTYHMLLEYLIRSDISIYLGEASATLDTQLLKNVIWCIKCFSKINAFYKNAYAAYTTASLIRTIQLYLKEDKHEDIVQSILYLLYEMFSEIVKSNSTPVLSLNSSYDTLQILNLLNTIIVKPNIALQTSLLATKLFHTMIYERNTIAKYSETTIKSITDIIKLYLNHLRKIIIDRCYKSKDEHFGCIFGLACHIGIDAFYICNVMKNYLPSAETEPVKNLVLYHFNEIKIHMSSVEDILKSVQDVMNTFVTRIKDCERLIDHTSRMLFQQFLNTFFHEFLLKETLPTFAEHLLCNDFLVFLPTLRANSQDKEFRRICQMNLAELLVILSHHTFNLTKWKGGKEEFRNHIYEGLLENEDDLNAWLKRLTDASSADSTLNSLIIFLYFYCKTPATSSQTVIWKLLPYIVYYILEIPRKARCPSPITKCLWLIFSMANSFGADVSIVNGGKLTIEKANWKIVKLISINMQNVYTHHTAIIEWAYSSSHIPFNVQNNVLSIWLQNQNDLPPKLLQVPAVWWSLLDIIQNSNENTVLSATSIFKHCMNEICDKANSNKLKDALWEMLPNMLIFYIDENCIANELTLSCVLELCCTYLPVEPDMDTIKKSVFLLTSIIQLFVEKSDGLLCNYMSMSFCIINISLKQQNTIVLSRFINSDIFMETVFDATKSSSDSLSTIAFKILSFSAHYSEIYNLEFSKSYVFDPNIIVKSLMVETDDDKCCAILQMIFTSFQTYHSDRPQLVSLVSEYSPEYLLTLFRALNFRLHMICCKESKLQSYSGWQCLSAMLDFSAKNKDRSFIEMILHQPWIHVLIRYYISQNDSKQFHDKFLNFIHNWLLYLKEIGKTANQLNYRNSNSMKNTFNLLKMVFHIDVQDNFDASNRVLVNKILEFIAED